MKKIILLSAVLATSLLAEMTTEVIKDAAVSEAKSEVRKAVVEEVKDIAEEVRGAVEDTNNSASEASSIKDKAVDSDTIKQ